MQHNTQQPQTTGCKNVTFDKHLSHHTGSCDRPAVDDSGKQLQQEESTDTGEGEGLHNETGRRLEPGQRLD